MMSELPKGWLSIELENFVYIAGRIGWRGLKRSEYTESGAAFLAVKNILPNGNIDFSNIEHISQERYDESPEIQIKKNDIVLTKDGTIGKIGMVSYLPFQTTVNSSLLVVRPCELILPRFLFYYLRGPQFQTIARERISGSAVPHLFQKDIKKLVVVVPPLNEQRRIVAKLEKLLAKVDTCKERLDKIPGILKRFRQSVLSAACSGRLTADWRENNPDVESAEELLKRIQEKRFNQAGTVAQRQKLNEIYLYNEKENSDLLPETWRHITLEKLCSSCQYGTSAKSMLSGRVAVLRMGNIQNGNIDWSDLVYTSDEKEIEKYKLKRGDVLFNRTNSPELVGKTAIYRGEVPAIFAGYLIKINNYEELDSEYLNYCLNTVYAKNFCLSVKTDGVSQSNINAQKLGKFEVSFCPLQEQQEIVRRVQHLFKTADQIEQRYQKARTYIDQLTQSILAKAFRGELVPQDPNDEPASVLLERIRAERENRENVAKTAKKPAANKKQRSKKAQPQLEPAPQLEPTPQSEPIQLELPLFE